MQIAQTTGRVTLLRHRTFSARGILVLSQRRLLSPANKGRGRPLARGFPVRLPLVFSSFKTDNAAQYACSYTPSGDTQNGSQNRVTVAGAN